MQRIFARLGGANHVTECEYTMTTFKTPGLSGSLLLPVLLLSLLVLAACSGPEDSGADAVRSDGDVQTRGEAGGEPALGPVDGHDLPPVDLDRVQVGDEAPDFTLASLDGPAVTLSDLRGEKNVVLVFYRGHW